MKNQLENVSTKNILKINNNKFYSLAGVYLPYTEYVIARNIYFAQY